MPKNNLTRFQLRRRRVNSGGPSHVGRNSTWPGAGVRFHTPRAAKNVMQTAMADVREFMARRFGKRAAGIKVAVIG